MIHLLVTLVVTPLAWWLYGNTISHLWAWFVVPVFALPGIGVWQAAGIHLLFNLLAQRVHRSDTEKESDEQFAMRLASALAYPVIALGLGWVLKTLFL